MPVNFLTINWECSAGLCVYCGMTTSKQRIAEHLREVRTILDSAEVEQWARDDIKVIMFSIMTELRSLKDVA